MSWLKPEYLVLAYLMVVLPVLMWKGKMPSIDSFQKFVNLWNSKGGNMFLLAVFTTAFFVAAIRFLYWTVDMVRTGTLTADNAVLMLGLNFVTSSAFGTGFGALLKTMTGESEPAPKPETEKK